MELHCINSVIYIVSASLDPNNPLITFYFNCSRNDRFRAILVSCEEESTKESHKTKESECSPMRMLFNDVISAVKEDCLSAKF